MTPGSDQIAVPSSPKSASAPGTLSADVLNTALAPGLVRRIAVGFYDLLLVFGIISIAATLVVVPYGMISGGELKDSLWMPLFQVYLLGVFGLYFVYFWSDGRQSLGMRTWRCALVRTDGAPLTSVDALRRLLMILLTPMIGLLWALFDRDGLAWYDRLSKTRPVIVAK